MHKISDSLDIFLSFNYVLPAGEEEKDYWKNLFSSLFWDLKFCNCGYLENVQSIRDITKVP